MLFPHLIAGPIVRYADIAEQMKSRRLRMSETRVWHPPFHSGPEQEDADRESTGGDGRSDFRPPGARAERAVSPGWRVLCYTFQIYFDFSGYSDMAIGLAPHVRLHASTRILTIPTHRSRSPSSGGDGTSRCRPGFAITCISRWEEIGAARRVYLNLFIVFLLCGFWHGASWNFVIWGLVSGVLPGHRADRAEPAAGRTLETLATCLPGSRRDGRLGVFQTRSHGATFSCCVPWWASAPATA